MRQHSFYFFSFLPAKMNGRKLSWENLPKLARFMDRKVINLWISLTYVALTIIALNENRKERRKTRRQLCIIYVSAVQSWNDAQIKINAQNDWWMAPTRRGGRNWGVILGYRMSERDWKCGPLFGPSHLNSLFRNWRLRAGFCCLSDNR